MHRNVACNFTEAQIAHTLTLLSTMILNISHFFYVSIKILHSQLQLQYTHVLLNNVVISSNSNSMCYISIGQFKGHIIIIYYEYYNIICIICIAIVIILHCKFQ